MLKSSRDVAVNKQQKPKPRPNWNENYNNDPSLFKLSKEEVLLRKQRLISKNNVFSLNSTTISRKTTRKSQSKSILNSSGKEKSSTSRQMTERSNYDDYSDSDESVSAETESDIDLDEDIAGFTAIELLQDNRDNKTSSQVSDDVPLRSTSTPSYYSYSQEKKTLSTSRHRSDEAKSLSDANNHRISLYSHKRTTPKTELHVYPTSKHSKLKASTAVRYKAIDIKRDNKKKYSDRSHANSSETRSRETPNINGMLSSYTHVHSPLISNEPSVAKMSASSAKETTRPVETLESHVTKRLEFHSEDVAMKEIVEQIRCLQLELRYYEEVAGKRSILVNEVRYTLSL